MMKRLFQVFALLLIPNILCAQGTVDFRNRVSGTLDVPVFFADGGTLVSGPDFVAQLYFSNSSNGPFALVADPPAVFRTGAGAGYWNPGEPTRVLEGIEPWSSTAGASYQVQSKIALGLAGWNDEGEPIPGTGGLQQVVLPKGDEALKIFRLVETGM